MGLKWEMIRLAGYEKVVRFLDTDVGLEAVIAIHNTSLGPGLGGTRIYPYKTFANALTDVLRLSKSMTYKAGMAQVGLGGAKSVIIADPKTDKTPALLHAFAEAVNTLEGEYICAEDIGCTPEDIATIIQKTKYACGICNLRGSGNPANYTAWGVLQGIKSICQQLDNSPSIEGKTIAIQGIGNVGSRLAELLFWEGAQLILADRDESRVIECAHRYAAKTVSPSEILSVECDIVSPNAMGAVLNGDSIPHLRCRAIAGGANNQLLETIDADTLAKRGILYAPDFVINAGGLINVIHEFTPEGYRACCARETTKKIYHQLLDIYEIARRQSISTHQAAVSIVDERLKLGIGKRKEPLVFSVSNDPIYCKTV